MDQVTQQNAALVEQAAAAADAMRGQAGGLAQAVGVFKLDGTNAPGALPVATATRSVHPSSVAAVPQRVARAALPKATSADGWEEF
jgi:hypothetical protein